MMSKDEYLDQFKTDAYSISYGIKDGKEVYMIVNNYTSHCEADTSMLPEAVKVVTDFTKMLELPSEILTPPKQDIIT